tara:strand:- start:224 stop:523 length:300 start_codon:yes stop_codon:yes gene_type:complete
MNNRFENLVENKKDNKEPKPENKKDIDKQPVSYQTNNIFIKSETKYYENKRKEKNSFSNYKKRETFNSFTRKFRDDKKEPKPEKEKPDIKNTDEFPPLQ